MFVKSYTGQEINPNPKKIETLYLWVVFTSFVGTDICLCWGGLQLIMVQSSPARVSGHSLISTYMTAFDRWGDLWQCGCVKVSSRQMAHFLILSLSPNTEANHTTCPLILLVSNKCLHPSPASGSNLGLNTTESLSNKHEYGIEPRLTVFM